MIWARTFSRRSTIAFSDSPRLVRTPVIEDSGGYFFYKVVSKQQVTLASVKDEIRQTLTGQRMRDEQLKFQNASMPTLNEKYFGGGTPAAPPNAAKPAGPSSAPKKETPNPKPQPK